MGIIADANGITVALLDDNYAGNGPLIAAAPTMREALIAWLDAYESGELEKYDDAFKKARRALAQAEEER